VTQSKRSKKNTLLVSFNLKVSFKLQLWQKIKVDLTILGESDPNGGGIVRIHTVIDHLRRETMGLQGELQCTVETADDDQCLGPQVRHIDDGSD
jgi:hypothetical protein